MTVIGERFILQICARSRPFSSAAPNSADVAARSLIWMATYSLDSAFSLWCVSAQPNQREGLGMKQLILAGALALAATGA